MVRELGSTPGTCNPVWAPDGSRLAVVAPNGLWTYFRRRSTIRGCWPKRHCRPPRSTRTTTPHSRGHAGHPTARIAYFVTNGATSWVEAVDVTTTRRVFKSPPGVTVFAWGDDADTLVIDGQAQSVPR